MYFLRDYPEVVQYAPEGKELKKVPKQWIIDVANTVVGQPFE